MRSIGCVLAMLALLVGCGRPVVATAAIPSTPTPDVQQQLLDALAPRCAERRDVLLQDAVSAAQTQTAKGMSLTTIDALGAAVYVLNHAPRLLMAPDGLTNCATVLLFVGEMGTPQGATDLADIVNTR